ncbi:MAG: PP2C family serine/threonine-protein phosphatase [Marivibrio sp.]|uniref:PP2C family serine/threonine-protein phosphatase n=1 Tax=Marivibrio sp. TaxID=2039719 RepID=UPI0032EC849A
MSWTAAVDFRQGADHRRSGAPCQDFGRLTKPNEDLLLGALADGAGSAPLSHLGAHAAVQAALALLEARVAQEPGRRGDPAGGDGGPEALFDGIVEAAQAALSDVASQHRRPVEDFATTLLAFAAGPRGIACLQLGDGWLVARDGEGAYLLLGRPQRGEYANETRFLSDADAADAAALHRHKGPAPFLCAATDGLASVSIDNRGDAPHAPFFEPLDRFIGATDDDREAHRAIRSFLRSDALEARTADDVALMLGGWRPVAPHAAGAG